MKMPDFSKFPQSIYHSVVAVLAALLAALLIVWCASALSFFSANRSDFSSYVSSDYVESEGEIK